MKTETQNTKNYEMQQKMLLRRVANSSISLPQEIGKILNKKFHFIPRGSRKQRTNETPN